MEEFTLETRKCKTCRNDKPLQSGFRPHVIKGKTYYDYECRACQGERAKKWHIENKDRANGRRQQWYRENLARERAKGRAAYQRDIGTNRARAASRRKGTDGDRVRELDAATARRWRAAHPLEAQIGPSKRRALKRNVQVEPITQKQLDELLAKQKSKCAICKQKLKNKHLDHIKPLKLGGEHAMKNFQYLCPKCNLSKRQHDPIDFMQTRGYLL